MEENKAVFPLHCCRAIEKHKVEANYEDQTTDSVNSGAREAEISNRQSPHEHQSTHPFTHKQSACNTHWGNNLLEEGQGHPPGGATSN